MSRVGDAVACRTFGRRARPGELVESTRDFLPRHRSRQRRGRRLDFTRGEDLIQSTDVVLPSEDGRELRLRCVVRPDAAQAALLDRLGLDLPQRLRVPLPSAQNAEV